MKTESTSGDGFRFTSVERCSGFYYRWPDFPERSLMKMRLSHLSDQEDFVAIKLQLLLTLLDPFGRLPRFFHEIRAGSLSTG